MLKIPYTSNIKIWKSMSWLSNCVMQKITLVMVIAKSLMQQSIIHCSGDLVGSWSTCIESALIEVSASIRLEPSHYIVHFARWLTCESLHFKEALAFITFAFLAIIY